VCARKDSQNHRVKSTLAKYPTGVNQEILTGTPAQDKCNVSQMSIPPHAISLFSSWFVWKQDVYFSLHSAAWHACSGLSVC